MTTDNFCFYLQNRLIQTSQTGGQWYSDNSPFSIPCPCIITVIGTAVSNGKALLQKEKEMHNAKQSNCLKINFTMISLQFERQIIITTDINRGYTYNPLDTDYDLYYLLFQCLRIIAKYSHCCWHCSFR